MANATQQRVLARLHSDVGERNFALIDDKIHANTGTLSAVKPKEITSARRVRYQFNDDYMTFKLPGKDEYWPPELRKLNYVAYREPDDVEFAVAALLVFLTERT